MKYAIISDSHDSFYNLEKAMEIIKTEGVSVCFHLGDYCAPGFVKAMLQHAEISWVCIWGNVDGAKAKILLDNKEATNFDMAPEAFREYATPDGKIFLTHFPLLGQIAAKSGKYRAVFYGDDHKKFLETQENSCVLVNPGELAGFVTGQPSFAIWDSQSNEARIIDLVDFKITK